MNPHYLELYRASTARNKPINSTMKMCAGPCKQRRSVGQFAEGDSLCIKCRRRATP